LISLKKLSETLGWGIITEQLTQKKPFRVKNLKILKLVRYFDLLHFQNCSNKIIPFYDKIQNYLEIFDQ